MQNNQSTPPGIELNFPDSIALLRLLQLASPTLPVGAYAYSQGLEQAVAQGIVTDEDSARDWIAGVLQHGVGLLDAPLLMRLYGAWQANDLVALRRWNQQLYALRETAELQAEDYHLGAALARLLRDMQMEQAQAWVQHPQVSFALMFALAAWRWQIPMHCCVQAYLWCWCENQVAAAIKLVPLGQTAGQRMLGELAVNVDAAVQHASSLADAQIGMTLPGWVAMSVLHETQYTRLFRS